MAIKLLSFDLDDTLWPTLPTILRAEQALYEWMQQNIPEIARHYDVDSLREHRKAYRDAHPEVAHCMTQLRRASFRDLSERHGHHDDWIEDAFAVFYQHRQRVEYYGEVAGVLDELVREYRMVALTNGNADIAITGADRWMDFSLNPEQAGVAKPQPEIFHQLLQRAGVGREEMVHIGDHPVHDVQGAVEAGVACIWINRGGRDWPDLDFRPDAEIPDLSDLPATLRALQRSR